MPGLGLLAARHHSATWITRAVGKARDGQGAGWWVNIRQLVAEQGRERRFAFRDYQLGRGWRAVRYRHYLPDLASKSQAVRQMAPELTPNWASAIQGGEARPTMGSSGARSWRSCMSEWRFRKPEVLKRSTRSPRVRYRDGRMGTGESEVESEDRRHGKRLLGSAAPGGRETQAHPDGSPPSRAPSAAASCRAFLCLTRERGGTAQGDITPHGGTEAAILVPEPPRRRSVR